MALVAGVDYGASIQNFFSNIFGYLPNIIGFLVILVIGYIVARLVKAVVNRGLEHFKVDERLQATSAGGFVERISPGGRPSHIVGGVAFWLIFLYAVVAALGALKIPAVTAFLNQVLGYLPNVVVAVLIFVIAAVISGAVVAAVQRTMGDTPTGKLAETVVPGLVMAIAIFMILTQLKIASTIVTITYTALIGMLALAGALAFGLGGREVASRMWQSAYDNAQGSLEQAKSDARTGQARGRAQLEQAGGTYPAGSEGAGTPSNQRRPR
jgi:hypothetical protein